MKNQLHCQEFQMLEFFAGKANLSKCMKATGFKTASFDILYEEGRKPEHNSNFMDINSPSGFAYFDSNCIRCAWGLFADGNIAKGTTQRRLIKVGGIYIQVNA